MKQEPWKKWKKLVDEICFFFANNVFFVLKVSQNLWPLHPSSKKSLKCCFLAIILTCSLYSPETGKRKGCLKRWAQFCVLLLKEKNLCFKIWMNLLHRNGLSFEGRKKVCLKFFFSHKRGWKKSVISWVRIEGSQTRRTW